MRKKNPQQYTIFTIDAPDITGKKKLKLSQVCFLKSSFRETIFQTFLCLFVSSKVGQRKIFSGQFQSKKNLTWFLGKCFPEKFGGETLSGSCEKIKNVIIC